MGVRRDAIRLYRRAWVLHGFRASVQDTLLALCQRMLTANGIAYISYNALPGCHLRRMIVGHAAATYLQHQRTIAELRWRASFWRVRLSRHR